ncbi:MAG: hypothetical protein KJ666_10975 [Bacteroidetes bacterium]|nr:hypothetical protein [Bacteroidota bacterium]
MKKLFSILIVAMSIFAACNETLKDAEQVVDTHHIVDANSIEGFLGIKWGTPIDSAKLMLLQRNPTARISTENPYSLVFLDFPREVDCPFKIFDTKMNYLSLEFSSHGFCSAGASFDKLTDYQSTALYLKLKETLESKYGQPSKLIPYDNDWQFASWHSRDSCSIIISIDRDDDNRVFLLYSNEVLSKTRDAEKAEYYNRLEQQKKEKILKDF